MYAVMQDKCDLLNNNSCMLIHQGHLPHNAVVEWINKLVQTWTYTPLDISSFFFFFFFLFFVLFGQAFLRLVMRTQRALERGWDSSLVLLGMCCWEFEIGPTQIPRGGTDLEKGYGDVRPWRPPFHASSAARKGPISSKRVRLQDPL